MMVISPPFTWSDSPSQLPESKEGRGHRWGAEKGMRLLPPVNPSSSLSISQVRLLLVLVHTNKILEILVSPNPVTWRLGISK